MIRIGIVLSYTDGNWVGGINYISNLLHAVSKIPSRKIEPVLIVPPDISAQTLAQFPPGLVLRTALADVKRTGLMRMRKIAERGLGCDFLMRRFLRANRIDLLSHSGQLGVLANYPCIGWLPDFQHVRMPEFFTPNEIAMRNRGYRRIVEQCKTVILSSLDAQQDLAKFAPNAMGASRVLNFVSGMAGGDLPIVAEAEVRSRYGIAGPYFHLPNQFWAHKNHRVVIDALSILKSRGKQPVVVCTGNTNDRRQPKHFSALMSHAEHQGVANCFRVIGLVPYADLVGLMSASLAVINPSLFEGWSTTVEESKSLGLRVLLSDIPVHREQAPERAEYFLPRDAHSLASGIERLLQPTPPEIENAHRSAARARLSQRFASFGTQYQKIVLESMGLPN